MLTSPLPPIVLSWHAGAYCCDFPVTVNVTGDGRVVEQTMYRRTCTRTWNEATHNPCNFFRTFTTDAGRQMTGDSFPCYWKKSVTSKLQAFTSCGGIFIGHTTAGSCNIMLTEEFDFLYRFFRKYRAHKDAWIAMVAIGAGGIVWGLISFVGALYFL